MSSATFCVLETSGVRDVPFEYVNRRGDRYYLLQGKTKTGKPKYYVSRKSTGVAVDAVPEGYELHENPADAIVSVRKVRPTHVTPDERECLGQLIREVTGLAYFIIDVTGDSMVVYTPDRDPSAAAGFFSEIMGLSGGPEEDWIARHTRYTAMLRFTLTVENTRLYGLDRWCFRGRIDGWLPLAGDTLEQLARKYLPHLGQESFFELI